ALGAVCAACVVLPDRLHAFAGPMPTRRGTRSTIAAIAATLTQGGEMRKTIRRLLTPAAVAALAGVLAAAAGAATVHQGHDPFRNDGRQPATTTPIKHVVVIFQENVSFDHYFATYPDATNPQGEPGFRARRDTPSVDGLNESFQANMNAANPFRLD